MKFINLICCIYIVSFVLDEAVSKFLLNYLDGILKVFSFGAENGNYK